VCDVHQIDNLGAVRDKGERLDFEVKRSEVSVTTAVVALHQGAPGLLLCFGNYI